MVWWFCFQRYLLCVILIVRECFLILPFAGGLHQCRGRHAGLPLRLMTYILFIPLYSGEVGGAAAYSLATVYLGKKMLYVAVERCLQGYITMRHLRAAQE